MTNAVEIEGTEFTNVSLRYNKEDIDLAFDELTVEGEALPQNADDASMKRAVENSRDMDEGVLDSYVVERYPQTGQVVIRPQTEWGEK